jgi:ABC-2 type transport system ATP-binding protein
MSDASSPIVASGLVRHFGDVRAVDGVDLEVRSGEIFGLLGPNGAGKTTTIRILTTLIRPTSGTARVLGHDVVHEAKAVRRKVSLTGQAASVDEDLTGRENLILVGRLLGLPWAAAKTRADQMLEAFGLVDAGGRQVRTYSGGMRRRVDIAASLVVVPEVLFLDEPTTGLDPRSRNQVWELVRFIAAEGTTVLLTTQYLEEADRLAERMAVIDHGRIVQQGTPSELKAAVGVPTLLITVSGDEATVAADVLRRFGDLRPTAEGAIGVGLSGGARQVTDVVRALDEAGVALHHLELNEPSLDDVFAEATGYRLEGAGNAPEAGGNAPDDGASAPPARGRRRGRK